MSGLVERLFRLETLLLGAYPGRVSTVREPKTDSNLSGFGQRKEGKR